jgi:hypothetical protein
MIGEYSHGRSTRPSRARDGRVVVVVVVVVVRARRDLTNRRVVVAIVPKP